MGYYDENNDRLIIIYQISNIVRYYAIQNITFLYYFKCSAKTVNVISNTESTFNISELIVYPLEHKLLHLLSVVHYRSTTNYVWSYAKYTFVKDTQLLTVNPSSNDWVAFDFSFYGNSSGGIETYFIISLCTVTVKTCAYKCGSCSEVFNKCDYGSCKSDFAQLRDSNDTNCYPNDQNFPNYIYDYSTSYYEKCYSSCKFCSLKGSLSSNLVHNCLTCNEGYLKSYEYMGNCYKIEYPLNNSDTKIINNKENDSYSVVDSCLNQVNKFKIVSTGECVSKCPESTVYHTFTYQKINFEEQGILPLEKMYPLTIEKPPKFLFGNLCYVNCPITTNTDNDNNLCKCKYGWEQDEITKEINCYNNKEYCLSKEY